MVSKQQLPIFLECWQIIFELRAAKAVLMSFLAWKFSSIRIIPQFSAIRILVSSKNRRSSFYLLLHIDYKILRLGSRFLKVHKTRYLSSMKRTCSVSSRCCLWVKVSLPANVKVGLFAFLCYCYVIWNLIQKKGTRELSVRRLGETEINSIPALQHVWHTHVTIPRAKCWEVLTIAKTYPATYLQRSK